MPRALKTLAVIVLVALIPLRAMAAVTIGFCAAGHKEMAVAALADHGRDAGAHAHHGGHEAPANPATSSCSICVEHCSNAAFALAASSEVTAPAAKRDRIPLAGPAVPAFVPDQLDRPPLA